MSFSPVKISWVLLARPSNACNKVLWSLEQSQEIL